jgi:putative acetyltransferase
LALSLVATAHGDVIGHVAFSPVSIDGAEGSWWCLGPLSVATAHRRSGVGSSLIRSGLRRLADRRVDGCVVSGDPDYYQRFGFGPSGGLYRPAPPADPFMALAVGGVLPAGRVEYHAAFGVNR